MNIGFGMVASIILGLLGTFYLVRGKKTQSPRLMLIGAVLIVLSYVLF